MSERRHIWETLSTLSTLLTQLGEEVEAALKESGPPSAALEGLENEVRKLGKAQFKANMLAEEQSTQWEQIVASLQETQKQRDQLLETVADERGNEARRELLEAFLPALDGLEQAIASGRRYLAVRDRAAGVSHVSSSQAILISPADRAVLAGWLDGLRLVRERMLAILKAGDVIPIPTVGHQFDPYLHVAVGTTSEGNGPPGTIVAEERRGYRSPAGVLRFAEVIVYRPKGPDYNVRSSE
ncbi:MAG: nucleotide exchange factor GrpE [Chloroflexi bacterium]|nr:MAG: nucleotide exchange factor GrpE [Chloroflexota bacterium]